MKLAPHKIREAREANELTYSELARRIAKRDEYHLGTTSGGQIRRWEEGRHRMRFESETIVAIAAETGRDVSFFYETGDDGAASDDEEAAPVAGDLYADLTRVLRQIVEQAMAGATA